MYKPTDKVKDIWGLQQVKGEFGIEIEMEGENNPFPINIDGWTWEGDGSLKADYAIEYLTPGAIAHKEVPKSIQTLHKALAKSDTHILDSVRAGVHVHMNCLDMSLKDMWSIALTYMAMERALMRFCGKGREGNHFCLRASDAESLVDRMYIAMTKHNFNAITNSAYRYSSINFASLRKLGTLEFRGMRTDPNLKYITEWVDILARIRNYGQQLHAYTQIAEDISHYGPRDWVRHVLGEKLFKLIDYPQIELDIIRDMRNVQPILYSGAL